MIRLTVRNIYKTVKINFWYEHIRIIKEMEIKKNDKIILEDIKKKKIYLWILPINLLLFLLIKIKIVTIIYITVYQYLK
jgi:hypothetical protein